EEKAAEAARLRRGLELDRRQLLWKEERISVLEEGIDTSGIQQGVERLIISGDPAPESARALPASSPPASDNGDSGGALVPMDM
ncbi:hypothetical protein FQN49_005490, partial [Arthroderma sp. PD_2]